MGQRAATGGEITRRFWSIFFGLLILGAAWYLLELHWAITVAIAALIIVSGALPPLIGSFVGALGWFGLAALVHFYYGGGPRLPVLLMIVGLVFLGTAIAQAARSRGAAGG